MHFPTFFLHFLRVRFWVRDGFKFRVRVNSFRDSFSGNTMSHVHSIYPMTSFMLKTAGTMLHFYVIHPKPWAKAGYFKLPFYKLKITPSFYQNILAQFLS